MLDQFLLQKASPQSHESDTVTLNEPFGWWKRHSGCSFWSLRKWLAPVTAGSSANWCLNRVKHWRSFDQASRDSARTARRPPQELLAVAAPEAKLERTGSSWMPAQRSLQQYYVMLCCIKVGSWELYFDVGSSTEVMLSSTRFGIM